MRDNKFKVQTSADKVTASVFWDSEEIFVSVILEGGTGKGM
jgi:hypothetical protein